MDATEINSLRARAYEFLRKKDWVRARDSFERIFDGSDASVASCLGFIYDQQTEFRDVLKAMAYYRIAADSGDMYANYALGGLHMERGDTAEALDWYEKCSRAGDSNCSYAAYRLYKKQGDQQRALIFLERAVEQGHPVATQKYAGMLLLGRFGRAKIPKGLPIYISNIWRLIRFIKDNVD